MEDYKKRMIQEYHDLKKRHDRLHWMLVAIDAGTADFEPSCSPALLHKQLDIMNEYLFILEVRASIEKINLGVE